MKTPYPDRRPLCQAILLASLTATPAIARAQVPTGETGFVGIEEVIVTARKREESVQNTPVSMVAVGAEGLKARSVDSFGRLGEVAPNIEINGGIPNGGGSATQIVIRGIGQDDYSFPNEPGVGLYIDDVYISRSAAAFFGFGQARVVRAVPARRPCGDETPAAWSAERTSAVVSTSPRALAP